jgi:ribosome-associated protein YbcJ (S4-like RNA binding protein)
LIEEGAVRVNGAVKTRRWRQLRGGDVVASGGEAVRIACRGAVRRRRPMRHCDPS